MFSLRLRCVCQNIGEICFRFSIVWTDDKEVADNIFAGKLSMNRDDCCLTKVFRNNLNRIWNDDDNNDSNDRLMTEKSSEILFVTFVSSSMLRSQLGTNRITLILIVDHNWWQHCTVWKPFAFGTINAMNWKP